MSAHFDTSSNFHPYECDGPGKCVHCDRVTVTGSQGDTVTVTHDPATCALCDPDYDKQPNERKAAGVTRFAAIETLRRSLGDQYPDEVAALAALQQLAEAADRVSPVALKHWTEAESDALDAAVARVKGNQA